MAMNMKTFLFTKRNQIHDESVAIDDATEGSLEAFEEASNKISVRITNEVKELVLHTHGHISFTYTLYPLLGSLLTVALIGASLSIVPQHDIMKVYSVYI